MPYPTSNVLLDSLPEQSRKQVSRHCRAIPLPVNTLLYEPNQPSRFVHFLTSGIASVVTTMRNGETTEVATVGREGIPQAVHLLGNVPIGTKCFMQIAGTGLRMDCELFHEIFRANDDVRRAALTYAQYQNSLLGQIAGCNRFHDVGARLARWFLMVQDRTGDSMLGLTQEFVGQMIGSRRTTVSAVAGGLQERGLIRYVRGKVHILDRPGLKKAACECYEHTRTSLRVLYSAAGQMLFDTQVEG